jgi:hypothetical protein
MCVFHCSFLPTQFPLVSNTPFIYLIQPQIPDTDADCLWDWRSLRCEPSCKCSFQFKSGDYHLGRSCRRRSAALDVCEPTVFIQDKPIPKRILSLVRQSTDILKENIKGTAHKVVQSTTRQYGQLQEHVCLDLWSRLHDNPATGIRCWSSVPETTTLPEKLLCGPIEGPMCDDEPLRGTKSPFATAAAAAATRMDRRKDTIFGDLYEKEF